MRSLDLLLISFFFIHFAYFLAIIYRIITTENVFRPDNQAWPVVRDFSLHLRSPDLLAVHSLFYFCKHDTTKRHKSHKSGFKFNIIGPRGPACVAGNRRALPLLMVKCFSNTYIEKSSERYASEWACFIAEYNSPQN